MLKQIRDLVQQRLDFAFESTLSGKSYLPMLRDFQRQGYAIHISYLWLDDVELSVKRVASRVKAGGHSIPEDAIRRRFKRGLRNFIDEYGPAANTWTLFDNVDRRAKIVAFKKNDQVTIVNGETYRRVMEILS